MILTDTHIHLYAEEFDPDRESLVDSALDAGVTRFFMPNIDRESVLPMLRVRDQWPDHCFPMMGIHPCSVKDDYVKELAFAEAEIAKGGHCAVGEIGMDLHWDKTFAEQQKDAFRIQCQWAVDLGLPVVIHCRESYDEIMDVLRRLERKPKGIFHCFTGNAEQAKEITDMGFYLGIGGVLTYKNSGLAAVLPSAERNRLLLETDGPYLAPVPFRGKRNEPSYILQTAQRMGDVLEVSLQEIASVTTVNSQNIFGI
jgi:TatD DNase family protein